MTKKLLSILFLFLLLGLNSCATRAPIKENTPEKPVEAESEAAAGEKTEEIIPEPPRSDYVTILAVGDNLFNAAMVQAGEDRNYESAYERIRLMVEKADIAFINQETALAGKDFGFSGYPLFNTPQKLGRAIIAAGFDVINHATNHIMDMGEKALLATMDFWDTIPEARILGIHRSEEQRKIPVLITKNSITMGFLSYTYGTNAIPLPKDKPYMVSLIDKEIMKKEIEALRPLCDFLIVSMHWGEEYKYEYSKSQQNLAAFLAEQNVDLVIGHHPHVIQPVEYIQKPNGAFMLCFYSLGNFLAAQIRTETLLGAMAYIKIKSGDKVEIAEAGAIPLISHYERDYQNMEVYPLHEYSEELAGRHRKNQAGRQFTMDYFSKLSTQILGDKEIRQNPFAP